MLHIFILHGNFSAADTMAPLQSNLETHFANEPSQANAEVEDAPAETPPVFHLVEYNYKSSLVDCAIAAYAKITQQVTAIGQTPDDPPGDEIILIGHSQGGLVCRLLALMMTGCARKLAFAGNSDEPNGLPEDVWKDWQTLLSSTNKTEAESSSLGPAKQYRVLGVAALASPHSGAFTMGQFSTLAGVMARGLKSLSADVFGAKNLKDLSSDRLPRLMQYMTVPNTKYLSISGSRVNRYTLGWDAPLSEAVSAMVPNFSAQLSKPNDQIVEEESADITNHLLPLEVETEPEHFNCYVNATDVTHFNIYKRDVVAKRLVTWVNALVRSDLPARLSEVT